MEDDQSKRKHLTPDECARIEREERERLERWIKNLPPEEAVAWLEAHEDDLEAGIEVLVQEKADFTAIHRVVAPIIQKNPNMAVGEALDFIRKKDQRTLAEAEALDAFERIRNKPLRKK